MPVGVFASSDICPNSGTCTTTTTFYPGINTQVTAGDILITTDTSYGGITGHTGIVTEDLQVAHIAGFGKHPDKVPLSFWFDTYSNTTIYRLKSGVIGWRTRAYNAGSWASNYTKYYSDAEYVITNDLLDKTETYCSKLVWQAYHYGANLDLVTGWTWYIVTPYSYSRDFELMPVAYVNSNVN